MEIYNYEFIGGGTIGYMNFLVPIWNIIAIIYFVWVYYPLVYNDTVYKIREWPRKTATITARDYYILRGYEGAHELRLLGYEVKIEK